MLGVGLHLYNGDKPANGQNTSHNRQPYPNQSRSSNYRDRRSKANSPDSGNGNENARLTSRQFKYIMRIADEAARDKEEIDQETLQMFGSAVQFLSKSDASSYIEHLLSK